MGKVFTSLFETVSNGENASAFFPLLLVAALVVTVNIFLKIRKSWKRG